MTTFSRRRQIADANIHDEVRQLSEELGRTSVLLRDIISEPHANENGQAQAHADEHGDINMTRNMEPALQAWLCVLGAFTFIIPSYGFMGSIGIMQSYLQLNQLRQYSSSHIGWISGVYLSLCYFFPLQIGPLCDYDGPFVVGPVGMAITITSFLFLAECKTYWQFMLCLGVLAALGGATIGTIAMAALAKLFTRRRGLAIGLALTGSAIGSIIFPIMLRSILPKYGWKWSMRIVALTIAGITVPGLLCFLPYRHLAAHPLNQPVRNRGAAILDLSAFRSSSFAFISIGSFMLDFAIFGIAGLLPNIALRTGLTLGDGYILVVVMNAGSCFGRLLPGLLADVFGPFNVMLMTVFFTLISMITMFVPFADKSTAVLYAFSALWGFGSGSFFSVPPVCVGSICPSKDYGRCFGTMSFFCGFAVLLTIPLGGILLDGMGVQALAALLTAVVFLGGMCYLTARALVIGKWFSPVTKV